MILLMADISNKTYRKCDEGKARMRVRSKQKKCGHTCTYLAPLRLASLFTVKKLAPPLSASKTSCTWIMYCVRWKQVDMINRTMDIDLSNYVENGEWQLLSITVKRNVVYYACCLVFTTPTDHFCTLW